MNYRTDRLLAQARCKLGVSAMVVSAVLFLATPRLLFGQIHFTDIAKAAGISNIPQPVDEVAGGVVALDFDRDGWEDFYVAGGQGYDGLYRNNHDGTFTDVSVAAGIHDHGRIFSHGGASLDIDQDGWPDLYIACEGHDLLFRNNHDGTFTDVTRKAGIIIPTGRNNNMTATFGDFDGDGLNDIYVTRYIDSVLDTYTDPITGFPDYNDKGLHNFLYVNNGNGTFTEEAANYGVDNAGCGLIAILFDYDRDGDLDLLIGNDFGAYVLPNAVYKNMLVETGTASFKDVTEAIGMKNKLFCMGIGPSDYDRDGDFDFFETTIGPEAFMQNNGGHFTNVAAQIGAKMGTFSFRSQTYDATTWSPIFVDMDNDGWEDLFEVHGTIPAFQPFNTFEQDTTRILRNEGGSFQDVTQSSGYTTFERGRGAMTFDFDHDGKMDIVVGCVPLVPINPTSGVKLLHNTSSTGSNHWLELTLHGKTCGAEAIGTCVEVWEHGNRHLRQVSTGGTLCSQSSLTQHVGIGTATEADSILIFWPRKPIERYYHVAADQRLDYTEGAQRAFVASSPARTVATLYPSVASDILHVSNLAQGDEVTIVDLLGRVLYSSRTTSTALRIPVGHFSSGAYTARVKTSSGEQVLKFIKQ